MKFKKTKAYRYFKKLIDKSIALGHNELGITAPEQRYSNL